MPIGSGKGGQGGQGKGGHSRGQGKGRSQGCGQRGRQGPGLMTNGNCICPNCGKKIMHDPGIPCYSLSCPQCGTKMIRE